jgi:AcrR family transcriptional regulator
MTAGGSADSIWMRPERAATGRPAQRSRAEIVAAAIGIADREGLDAVSMRRVAAELGAGAASLYRYVDTREELLDLMSDATGAEYPLPIPNGDWLAGLLAMADQMRAIMRRHPWLPGLVLTRAVIGPNGLAVLEHYLALLEHHPADIAAKMEAFAMLNGMTATFVLHEQAGGAVLAERNAAYVRHALTSGEHPKLARLLPQGPPPGGRDQPVDPANRFRDILTRVLTGLLGPAEPGSLPNGPHVQVERTPQPAGRSGRHDPASPLRVSVIR